VGLYPSGAKDDPKDADLLLWTCWFTIGSACETP
jgi:hypothetical protein